ncbi:crossover junction endonuclease EME1 isoform X2 [Colossoma macropomum]|uniref:crossover junction endonuclease EME1 isoform X2 n=1 Tax=Colossoma macropomum TaxID=42526 RepID=UPI0018646F8C|nr:crossover junction endonuclease EME1 isoform X2 [Colossoma macropomum]
MASLKRAKTWEVSDSEGEQTPVEPAGHSPAKDYDCLDPHSKTETNNSAPHCKTKTVSSDPQSKTDTVSSDPHSKTKTVSSDPHCEAEPVRLDSLIPPGSRAPSVSPGRKRRTQEEREEERARAEERRAERERARAERERAKEEKRQEQRRRREEAERVKSLKPENCLRSLRVQVHPVLLQDCGCDVLLGVLAGLEWSHCIEEHSLTHSISWTRQTPQVDGEDASGVVDEDQVLMVVSQREFMDMVASIKQDLIGGSEGAESLFQPLSEYLNRNSGTVVSLLVTGSQHNQRGSWNDDDDDDDDVCPRSQLGLQDIDIEELLVYLQLFKNVSVHFLFGWQEVTDYACAVTKALSKRPFKALCDSTDLGFCLDGSWSGGVRVDGSGRGLAQVWTRQIQQLNRVSAAMATAVTSAYPSPSLLLQAYKEAESEEEQRKLLADLTVRGGAKERRVGPELSNRVHRLMTSQNPQLVLD